jgi:hypothetical protein
MRKVFLPLTILFAAILLGHALAMTGDPRQAGSSTRANQVLAEGGYAASRVVVECLSDGCCSENGSRVTHISPAAPARHQALNDVNIRDSSGTSPASASPTCPPTSIRLALPQVYRE